MSKQLFMVTDIRLVEPVEGDETNHTIEDLENFKEHVTNVLRQMITEEVTLEVEVGIGYQVEEDGEEDGQ